MSPQTAKAACRAFLRAHLAAAAAGGELPLLDRADGGLLEGAVAQARHLLQRIAAGEHAGNVLQLGAEHVHAEHAVLLEVAIGER